ncbi:MAG: hypothetical protein FWD57_01215 [Polyangiaceae bacterium]|nr:hypothetical protein [Polyangiaceae bacterium]
MTEAPVSTSPPNEVEPAPDAVADASSACVQYVERKLGITLDYQPETLPILDHYIYESRSASPTLQQTSQETIDLIAMVSGCYFGELLRRMFPLQWNTEDQDPVHWSLSRKAVTIFPIAMALVALKGVEVEQDFDLFWLDQELSDVLSKRLEVHPPVSEDEYASLCTRLDVIETAFDVLANAEQWGAAEMAGPGA